MTMKQKILETLVRIPFGNDILREYRYWRNRSHLRGVRDANELFTRYFDENVWGNRESVSGGGSTVAFTENIRREIPLLIDRYKVTSILDAPCGDYNWFRLIPRQPGVHYTGADIVEQLVRRNQGLYGNDNTAFVRLDIRTDRLPAADLWLCRDCLPHLPNRDILSVIDNFLKSDIRLLLTSTYPECELNTDIPTGVFRVLNLQHPPFNFPEPVLFVDDGVEGRQPRKLGLWERKTLAAPLAASR